MHDAARTNFETALERTGSVLGLEVCLRHETGANLDCLASAERVEIGNEAFALLVLQDITERKRTERELFEAIEAVMADTSWFSRGLIEKLANLRQPGAEHKAASSQHHRARAPDPRSDLPGTERRRHRAAPEALAQHGPQPRCRALPQARVHKRSEAIVWGRDHGFPSAKPEP